MCSVLGAAAAAIIACTCHLILRRYTEITFAASCISGLLFGFSPLAWEHAIGAEVFALNNFGCACIVFLTTSVIQAACLYEQAVTTKKLTLAHLLVIAGSFFCGLAVSNQHSSALLLVVAIPSVLLATHNLRMSVPYLVMVAAAFVLPVSSYFYLLIAALHPKPGSWGDTSNIHGLITHILRAEYGTFKLGNVRLLNTASFSRVFMVSGITIGSESSLQRIWLYLRHSFLEGGCIGLPLAVVAVLYIAVASSKALGRKAVTASHSNLKQPKAPKKTSKAATVQNNRVGDNISFCDDFLGFSSDALSASKPSWEVLCLVLCWILYTLVWHFVFSNIPLSSPMPYGVHARY